MKTKSRKILSVILAAIMILSVIPLSIVNVFAQTSTDGNYEYTVISEQNKTVKITKYLGIQTVVTIPTTIDGYTAVELGYNSFADKSDITSVTVPESVTTIDYNVFSNCTKLATIKLGSNISFIDSYAFTNTAWYNSASNGALYIGTYLIADKNLAETGNFSVKDGTTLIASGALQSNPNITSVSIPASVKYIGNNCFYNMPKLNAINVVSGNNNFSSADGVLFNKDKSNLIAYPSGKTSTTYSVPDGVTDLSSSQFQTQQYIKTINIPKSVKFISESTFDSTALFENINVAADNPNYSSVDGILFNKDKTELVLYPAGKTATSYTVPNTVKTIYDYSFEYNEHIQSVIVPDSVEEIMSYAFSSCSSLASITLGNGLKKIGSNIVEITAWLDAQPDGLVYCNNCLLCVKGELVTEKITVNKGTTLIADGTFDNSDFADIFIPESVGYIGYGIFYNPSDVTIYGQSKSIAQIYAMNNAIDFVSLNKITLDGTKLIVPKDSIKKAYVLQALKDNGKVSSSAVMTDINGNEIADATKLAVGTSVKITDNSVTKTYVITELKYNLTYDANGGAGAPAAQTNLSYNTTFNLSNDIPTKSGFDFVGWASSSNAGIDDVTTYPGSEFVVLDDMTLYAVWTPTSILYGDVSGDGRISIKDAKLLLRRIAGSLTLSEELEAAADYNQDGKVSIKDAKDLLKDIAMGIYNYD